MVHHTSLIWKKKISKHVGGLVVVAGLFRKNWAFGFWEWVLNRILHLDCVLANWFDWTGFDMTWFGMIWFESIGFHPYSFIWLYVTWFDVIWFDLMVCFLDRLILSPIFFTKKTPFGGDHFAQFLEEVLAKHHAGRSSFYLKRLGPSRTGGPKKWWTLYLPKN